MRVVAFLYAHERGCPWNVQNGGCPGCEGRTLPVDVTLPDPPEDMGTRDLILLIRHAVLQRGREMVS